MAGSLGTVHFRVVIENRKVLRALAMVRETLEELAEDLPWRPDVGKAVKAAQYAISHLDLERSEE